MVARPEQADEVIANGRYVPVATVKEAVERYRVWLASTPEGQQLARDAKVHLRGKDLACWCKLGEPCHPDILLEVANK